MLSVDTNKLFEILETQNLDDLDYLGDLDDFTLLPEEQKKPLSHLFFKRAKHSLDKREDASKIFFDLRCARLLNQQSEFLIDLARCLYTTASRYKISDYFIYASEWLIDAYDSNSQIFESDSHAFHLWGNIFLDLYFTTQEYEWLEQALEKYSKALLLVEDEYSLRAGVLFWDVAQAWAANFDHSQESADLKESLFLFGKAAVAGVERSLFWLDYGHVLVQMGQMLSEVQFIDSAIELFKKVILKDESQDPYYVIAWKKLVLAASEKLFLTGFVEDLQIADRYFHEAIVALQEDSVELWREWGQIYIRYGWLNKESHFVEKGLEKLTSLKVSTTATRSFKEVLLIAEAMVMLGFLEDQCSLLQKGAIRLFAAYEEQPDNIVAAHSAAFAHLVLGLYFNDVSHLEKCIAKASYPHPWPNPLPSGLAKNFYLGPLGSWHLLMLADAHFALALFGYSRKSYEQIAEHIQQGSHLLIDLINERPQFYALWRHFGEIFLQLAQSKIARSSTQGYAFLEEAISKFEIALTLRSNDETLLIYSVALMERIDHPLARQEDSEELIADCTQALEILYELVERRPHFFPYLFHRTRALARLGRLQKFPNYLLQALSQFEQLTVMAKGTKRNEREGNEGGHEWLDLEMGWLLLTLSQLTPSKDVEQIDPTWMPRALEKLLCALQGGLEEAFYPLACLHSLVCLPQKAMAFLQRAAESGFISDESSLESEAWLSNVRVTPEYKEFCSEYFGEFHG